ncbi:MAG: F0F1 ATP synthase subunit B [Sulfurospirillum sp.]
MKKILYISLLILPVFMFGAGGEEANKGTDIIPRTVNFLIFAGILYYLAANQIKEFFVNRRASIAERLNSIQEKLKNSARQKAEAKELIEKAKIEAKTIMETSKEETQILKAKIFENLELDMENLEKGYEDQTSIERRKMTRAAILEILDDVFEKGSLSLEKDELLNIVMKKVA